MDGLLGCKTGITDAAGPCFGGYYEKQGMKIAIVLCHAKSMEQRWFEIETLVEWTKNNKNEMIKQAKKEKLRSKY